MFLETERLILRKLCDSDFDDFYSFSANHEMSRMMGRPDLTNRDAARRNFNWLKDREERGYAILLKETGTMIGNFTVSNTSLFLRNHPVLSGKKGCSLSFSISSDYRRKGLMWEVATAAIDRLFNEEHFDFINCGYFHFNDASRALQQKLGFQYLLTKQIELGGEKIDCIENILWNPHLRV